MNIYFISLTRGLSGYYIQLAATNEDVVRGYANNYYANNWCSVYTAEDMDRLRSQGYATQIINSTPIDLGDNPKYD